MNLYCDNYAQCNEYIVDQGSDVRTTVTARIKGWHVYDGLTIGGQDHKHTLGPRCVGQRARLTPAPEVLPGQETLF